MVVVVVVVVVVVWKICPIGRQKLFFVEFLKDDFGFRYLESLPENTREATLDDFHVQGKLILGRQFLILGYHWPVYQLYEVTEQLTGIFLMPFIEDHRVYIIN
jgi:hypothetical protein